MDSDKQLPEVVVRTEFYKYIKTYDVMDNPSQLWESLLARSMRPDVNLRKYMKLTPGNFGHVVARYF